MTKFDKNPAPKSSDYINFFVEEGVLHCSYKEIEMLDLEIAQKCVNDRLDYIEGQAYPSLFDVTKVKQTTKEARDYLANEGNALVTASAILVSSPMLKMAANFFIKVNRPKNPTRMFTDQEEALQWLAKFKQQ